MKYFALINKKGFCDTIIAQERYTGSGTAIPLETYDETVFGKKYENEEWIEYIEPLPERRNEAYKTMKYKEDGSPLIQFSGVVYTCDEAYAAINVYADEDKYAGTSKAAELGALWVEGKNYIRTLYPDE